MQGMIGVCISTVPSREALFNEVYLEWDKYLPEDAVLAYVVDERLEGVAKTKNASLRLLEGEGVTDYFLVDDDVKPLSKDWWKPFVESREPHLLYNFKLRHKPLGDMKVLYRDNEIISYSHTRGCFIYVEQKVLDKVGGFDERYYNGFEHPEYTRRIFNAGLTSHRSMSPVGAEKLLYCYDQDAKVETSIIKVNNRKNYELYRRDRDSKEYRSYK